MSPSTKELPSAPGSMGIWMWVCETPESLGEGRLRHWKEKRGKLRGKLIISFPSSYAISYKLICYYNT